MSTFYRAFRDHALGVTAITDLVGTRIHAVRYPQTPTYPAIMYVRVGQPMRVYTHSGDSYILTSRYRIEIADREDRDQATDALSVVTSVGIQLTRPPAEGGFSGFTGLLGVVPNQLEVGGMWCEGQSETYDADELDVLRLIQDWKVQHTLESY